MTRRGGPLAHIRRAGGEPGGRRLALAAGPRGGADRRSGARGLGSEIGGCAFTRLQDASGQQRAQPGWRACYAVYSDGNRQAFTYMPGATADEFADAQATAAAPSRGGRPYAICHLRDGDGGRTFICSYSGGEVHWR